LSIKLSWNVKRESGRPLLPADIDHYELTVTRDGSVVNVPAPAVSVLTYTFTADEPGKYGIGLVCVPKRGAKSDPATGSVEIFDETKVVVFDLTVEVVSQIP
jgi:hypothetical protein